MRIVDWVNRAFRDANAVNGAIPVPKLGDLEALFVNTRRAVAKVRPRADAADGLTRVSAQVAAATPSATPSPPRVVCL